MPRHGLRAAVKNGSTTSELAADAHACIMVRVTAIHRIQGCGASPSCPDSELPSDASSRPQQACQRARGCQGSAWKRSSGGQRRATAGPDSPCARRLPTRVGRGEETGFQVEQRNWDEESEECCEIALDLNGLHTRRGLAAWTPGARPARRPTLTAPARGASVARRSGRRNGRQARTKEQRKQDEELSMT